MYSLPLGLAMPEGTTPTCSACAKSLFGMYVGALNEEHEEHQQGEEEGDEEGRYDALRKTYDSAASQAGSRCGGDYASLSIAGSNGAGPGRTSSSSTWMVLLVMTLAVAVAL